jgi:hypothetical protein
VASPGSHESGFVGEHAKIAPVGTDRPNGHPWRIDVANICTGALLFDGRHSIGTEQGAVAVARDIRASTARRLARIAALRVHPARPQLAARWLQGEQRLSELYASTYLRIWHAIARPNSSADRAQLPRILNKLLHRPDEARTHAQLLEEQLQIPDCTGGEDTTPTAAVAFNP